MIDLASYLKLFQAANRSIGESHMDYRHDVIDDDINDINKEHKHILFLKVHKAASSTMQNIFYRFGMKRNLSFVLPIYTHYISKESQFFSDTMTPLPPKFCDTSYNASCEPNPDRKHDILCNHMVFNHRKCKQLVHPDSVYIAIVREPLSQFISSAYYYKFVWKYLYLKRLSNDTFIFDLLRDPQTFEATSMAESMTFNSMAYDFGFGFYLGNADDNKTDANFEKFLNKTSDTFDLVLVKEMFDESLVLMKRMLNWTLEDIVYIKNNVQTSMVNYSMQATELSEEDMNLFKKRNRFDYGIYELFRDRLIDQISKEQGLEDEVKQFRFILNFTREFCSSKKQELVELIEEIDEDDNEDDDDDGDGDDDDDWHDDDVTDNDVDDDRAGKEPSNKVNLTHRNPDSNTTTKLNDNLEILEILRNQKVQIPASQWNDKFSVYVKDCEYMYMDELTFTQIIKMRHMELLRARRRKHGVPKS